MKVLRFIETCILYNRVAQRSHSVAATISAQARSFAACAERRSRTQYQIDSQAGSIN
jgi:hypothetical protein